MFALLASAFAVATAAKVAFPPYDLLTLLQLNPNTATLVTAVVAGKLVTPLSGKGPFTIFAPDDYAFDRLPPGVLPDLLKNITLLDEILTYHVVSGNVSSSQLKNGEQVPTLNKQDITVEVHPGPNGGAVEVVLNQFSRVTYANNYGTNGVYHVIDRVLVPPKREMSTGLLAVFEAAEARAEEALIRAPTVELPALNLVQRLALIPEYSTLVTAVTAAKLVTALSGPGPFTLFAPDNYAFERLPPGALQKLLANITALTEVLTYHVAHGNVSSSDLKDKEEVPTLDKGKSILVDIFNVTRPEPRTVITLDHHAMVYLPNNYATNGVFHGIDEVLLPLRA